MKPIVLAGLTILLLGWVFGALWTPVHSTPSIEEPQLLGPLEQQQQEGWQVCAIAEIGPIPGVGNRQKVELCHSDGWRIMTYCIDPNQPVPVIGDYCSQTSPGVFWCGDGVQQLQYLSVLETPGPRATRTRTPTRAPTATPTRTVTPTPSRTALPQIEESPTPETTATPYYRPHAGGPGNLEVLGGLLAILSLAGGGFWWWSRRHARQAARGE